MTIAKPPFPRLHRAHPQADGLLLAMPLYEGSGDQANDLSGRDSHGTLVNGPAWSAGRAGWALSFDGSDDTVSFPRVTLAGPFTVCVWARITNAALRTIIGDDSFGDRIGYDLTAGKVLVRLLNTNDNTVDRPAVGNWGFYCLTRDAANKIDLSIDGGPFTRLYADAARSGMVNFNGLSNVQRHHGQIDDVRIYNRALSASEAAEIYHDPWAVYRPDRRASVFSAVFLSRPVVAASDASGNQTTSPISHTIPSGWSVGDLVVAYLTTAIRTVTGAPSGWNLLEATTGISDNTYAYWKVLGAGDLGASQSWTLNANPAASRIVFYRVTGAHASAPIDDSAWQNDAVSGTSHESPSVSTTVADCLILRLLINGGQALSAVSGDTGSKFLETTVSPGISGWASSKASPGATGTATYSTSANRRLAHIVVAIAPAVDTGEVSATAGLVTSSMLLSANAHLILPPIAPTNLVAVANGAGVDLSWERPADGASIEVWRRC